LSNLENGVALRIVDDKNGNDKYWQIGRQRHHPANQIRPQRVLLITVLHRVIFDETEHKNRLHTSSISIQSLQSGPKSKPPDVCVVTSSNIHRFSNSFTGTFSSKFAIKSDY